MNIFDKLNKKRTAQYYGAVGLVKGKFCNVGGRGHGKTIYQVESVYSEHLSPNQSFRDALFEQAFENDVNEPVIKKIIYCKSQVEMNKAEHALKDIMNKENERIGHPFPSLYH